MPEEREELNNAPGETGATGGTPTNMDEAGQAARGLFEGGQEQAVPPPGNAPEGAETAPPQEQQQQMPPGTQPPQPQEPPPEQIMRQAFGEIQTLRQENEQLKKAIEQQNEAQKQNVVEEALQMPMIDFTSLVYQDEEGQKAAQAKYAQDMSKFMQQSMMKELSPFIEQAREGIAQKQKGEAVATLSRVPELQGISQMLPQLDNIIANNKALATADVPLEEKYITAYLVAQGLRAQRQQAQKDQMTPEKFMELYNANPEFKDIVEKQRVASVKGAQAVPQFSPSGGAANAALTMPTTPKNFDEAYELSKKYFA